MAEITKSRTLTWDGEPVYARTHVQVVDGLNNATQSKDGLLSKEDKTKLDGLDNVTVPEYSVATTTQNGLMSSTDKQKLDGLKPFNPDDLTPATTSKAGLMSPDDKRKLDELKTNSIDGKDLSGGDVDSSGSSFLQGVDVWPNATQNITLSKRVSQCKNGIVLVWRSDAADDYYHYQHIPKNHAKTHNTTKIVEMVPVNSVSDFCIKTIILSDTVLTGTDDNKNTSTKANKVRLHEILEY